MGFHFTLVSLFREMNLVFFLSFLFLFFGFSVPLILAGAVPVKSRSLLVGEEVAGLFSAEEIVLLDLHELGLVRRRFLETAAETVHGRWRGRRRRRHVHQLVGLQRRNPSILCVCNVFVQDRARVAVRRPVFEIQWEHVRHLKHFVVVVDDVVVIVVEALLVIEIQLLGFMMMIMMTGLRIKTCVIRIHDCLFLI